MGENNGAKSYERIKTNYHMILFLDFNKLFVVRINRNIHNYLEYHYFYNII